MNDANLLCKRLSLESVGGDVELPSVAGGGAMLRTASDDVASVFCAAAIGGTGAAVLGIAATGAAGTAAIGGVAFGTVSGAVGVPRVARGAEGAVGEADDDGVDEGYGATGVAAHGVLGGVLAETAVGGVENDGDGPPMLKPGAASGLGGFEAIANGPLEEGADFVSFALENSIFGAVGHEAATPGGGVGSTLLRASET
jgi:hypothetical protein